MEWKKSAHAFQRERLGGGERKKRHTVCDMPLSAFIYSVVTMRFFLRAVLVLLALPVPQAVFLVSLRCSGVDFPAAA